MLEYGEASNQTFVAHWSKGSSGPKVTSGAASVWAGSVNSLQVRANSSTNSEADIHKAIKSGFSLHCRMTDQSRE